MPSVHFLEDLSIGNDQYSGPRPDPVEEKVSLLDPSSPSRGQGNCEGQVGCADGGPGLGEMGKDRVGIYGISGEIETPLFFVDGTVSNWESSGVYVRATEAIIGDNERYDSDLDTSRCFNCGSPDHTVSACPAPRDRQLISLSRQLFNFMQASRGITDFQRIHIVEEWRQQRLEWLDIFEPGEIRGSLLRDALVSDEGDWLKNMAVWGYPKGWICATDPREHVRCLIQKEHTGDWNDEVEDPEPFVIFGESNELEKIYFNGFDRQTSAHQAESDCDSDTSSSSMEESISDVELNDTTPRKPIRWARYPPTHFAYHLLPVYSGTLLPPISHRGSSTYTTDRQDLWQRIISGNQPSRDDRLPWRLPGAFETDLSTNLSRTGDYNPIPPPPTTEPPPLPPPPRFDGKVFPIRSDLSISAKNSSTVITQHGGLSECDDGSDMDMSDF